MRKMIVVLMLSLFAAPAVHATGLGDYIQATLLDNIVASGIYGFRDRDQGPAKIALTDSVIKLGKYQGSSIVDLQIGMFGNSNEPVDENQAVNYIFGAQFRLDPYVKSKLPLQPEWEFLKSIQFGPSVFYDATNHKWLPGLQVGLSFDLNPNLH